MCSSGPPWRCDETACRATTAQARASSRRARWPSPPAQYPPNAPPHLTPKPDPHSAPTCTRRAEAQERRLPSLRPPLAGPRQRATPGRTPHSSARRRRGARVGRAYYTPTHCPPPPSATTRRDVISATACARRKTAEASPMRRARRAVCDAAARKAQNAVAARRALPRSRAEGYACAGVGCAHPLPAGPCTP